MANETCMNCELEVETTKECECCAATVCEDCVVKCANCGMSGCKACFNEIHGQMYCFDCSDKGDIALDDQTDGSDD